MIRISTVITIVATTTVAPLFTAPAAMAQTLQTVDFARIWRADFDGTVYIGGTGVRLSEEDALRLLAEDLPTIDVTLPIVAILRQQAGSRPEAELDALAETVADFIIADTTRRGLVRENAGMALFGALSSNGPGIRHRGSWDALVRAYETVAAQGVLEPLEWGLVTLSDIYLADETRGLIYVQRVFDTSVPPPDCRRGGGIVSLNDPDPRPFCADDRDLTSAFCQAGRILHQDEVYRKAKRQYRKVFDGGPHTAGPLPVRELSEPAGRWWKVCWTEIAGEK